jgi:hypothetical protein
MPSPIEKREESSLIESIVDVVEAGQRVLVDRIELLSVEARLLATSSLTSLAFVFAGLGFLLVGWVAANIFVVLTLARFWNQEHAVALVAVVNVLAGGLALGAAKRRSTGSVTDGGSSRDGGTRGPGA